jgi:hypothetical protein
MVWHDDTRKRNLTPKRDMAPTLPLNNKTDSHESFDEIPSGKIRGEIGHCGTRVISTYSLPSSAGIGSPVARMSSR